MNVTGTSASAPRRAVVLAAAVTLALTVAGCARSESTASGTTAGGGPAASASSQAPSGPSCTLEETGYPKIDLKTATVGFSQSEKEGNPFRIAET
ncbi:MAG: hypothetical protein ACRCZD_07955, partial [Phycicoccus sp.]